VFIGINVSPDANLLNVSAGVRGEMPDILAQLPAGMHGAMVPLTRPFSSMLRSPRSRRRWSRRC
jgi:multidrug efflux pump subunit AcrB